MTHSLRRLVAAVLLSAALLTAWPAFSAIVVSYTLQAVTITDMTQCVIRPGRTAGEIVATGHFDVKDASGTVREQGEIRLVLAGQARTEFLAWANARMVNGFNAQRGL